MRPLLLLRPRLLGIKNTVLSRKGLSRSSHREIVFSLVSAILIFLVYRASSTTFLGFRQYAAEYGIQPDLPIAVFFSLLSGMVLLSASAAALGAFYLGHDLDFLLSKPLSPLQFLIGKGVETIFQSSWMMLVFGIPALAGIAAAYDMPWSFNLLGVVCLFPLLSIPTLTGISIVSLVIRLVPAKRAREFLFIMASVMILYIYLTAKDFMAGPPANNPLHVSESLGRLVRLSSSSWLPSAWAAASLGEYLLAPMITPAICWRIGALYLLAAILAGIAWFTLRTLHFEAFSNARSDSRSSRINSTRGQERLNRCLFFLSPVSRSLWAKEMKLFGRDLTQGLQLIMLLGICLVYLYNFKIVHQVGEVKPEVMLWWKSTLLICNIGMGAFIMTAVSSRFVFPSLSLEGNSFWIIRSAPVSIGSVLKRKFWIWYFPIAIISSVVLISGALAIDAEPIVILLTALVSWTICFGLVSLGIGLGSVFANFEWESSPQVTSSFGNFIYMLCGTLLIGINLVPIGIVVVLSTIRESGIGITPTSWNFALVSTSLVLVYLNYATYRYSLKFGEEALLKKL